MARPSEFTPERGAEICRLLAEGMSLRKICKKAGMPSPYTVSRWLADPKNQEFRAQYTHARDVGLDLMADEVLQIADTPKLGKTTKLDAEGKVIEVSTGDMAAHRRMQMDARRWYLSKLAPKRYGDRLELSGAIAFDRASALRRAREAKPSEGQAIVDATHQAMGAALAGPPMTATEVLANQVPRTAAPQEEAYDDDD